ncbi:DUF2255 family protein [Rhodococcus koreensis]|uniref:DUF2255 family protein n=1 Tax=Rhodococcus koreensis TaxID=99653 RepID=A0A1H4WXH5_9NOCA|nr:DUF2255 family protein [Rhodococcus koreensis]QSE80558.1 DUF2255 family protein [Rhodococcus koreensis]SEC97945.1 hypothetical protein SAMN04490239_6242 [Rhodococcus koreensis]
MAWHSEQLDAIGHTEELHISSYRRDGSLRRWIPICVVRVADDLYVRSAFGPDGGWYRNAMRNNTAPSTAAGPPRWNRWSPTPPPKRPFASTPPDRIRAPRRNP